MTTIETLLCRPCAVDGGKPEPSLAGLVGVKQIDEEQAGGRK